MIERHVEIAPDGSTYGDKVVLIFEGQEGERATYYLDPDGLYDEVHTVVSKFSQTSSEVPSDLSPEMASLQKRIAGLMRVAVKGILLMYGDSLLTLVFRTKNHARPQKGDDLIEWYTNMFTRVAIGYLMKKDTILTGKTVQTDGNESIVEINEVSTRPIPAPSAVG